MRSRLSERTNDSIIQTLAEFRYELRRFLHFSEHSAINAGLHPKQHQLLLQIAGAPGKAEVTVAYASERLGIKHNSAVELVDRSQREGLLKRAADPTDKRRARLRITRKGKLILGRLAGDHVRELSEMAPKLAIALEHIKLHAHNGVRAEAR